MKLFTTRSTTVEAVQLSPDNIDEVADWCNGVVIKEQDAVDRDKFYVALNIPTLDGNRRASQGQYVVRGNGGFKVMGQTMFESMYQSVNDVDDKSEHIEYTLDRFFGPRETKQI
jgi:hypothetical protein